MTLQERYRQAMNRVAKWRTVFAGWQLGTRPDTDPECQAVREQFNTMVSLRTEVNALAALLMQKGVFSHDEFMTQIIDECGFLERQYERRFPGFRAGDHGMVIDPKVAAETMKHWRK